VITPQASREPAESRCQAKDEGERTRTAEEKGWSTNTQKKERKKNEKFQGEGGDISCGGR